MAPKVNHFYKRLYFKRKINSVLECTVCCIKTDRCISPVEFREKMAEPRKNLDRNMSYTIGKAGADPDHVQHSIRLGKNFLKINSKINLSLYDNLCGGPVLLNPNALLPHPLLAPKSETPSLCAPIYFTVVPHTTAKCLIYRHLA